MTSAQADAVTERNCGFYRPFPWLCVSASEPEAEPASMLRLTGVCVRAYYRVCVRITVRGCGFIHNFAPIQESCQAKDVNFVRHLGVRASAQSNEEVAPHQNS